MQKLNSSDNVRSEIMRLVQPGVLGFYSHVEVTEIIGFPSKGSSPFNIFTLVVAEDREEAPQQEAKPLNPSRITVKSLREWCFGVYRYGRAIEDLGPAIDDLCDRKQWCLSGTPLVLGAISLAPRQFVPPDSVSSVPWNKVLKNNFWGGSHVFEWSDPEKALLCHLFHEPRRLQELSEAVQAFVPIKIASLSDRIGNVILQLPATVLMAKFAQRQAENEWVVQIGWHPKATSRPLRATCEIEFDSVVSGYVSCDITDASTPFSMPARHGLHRGIVWDEGNKIVLAATGPSAFINTVGLNMYIGDPEPRVFLRADPDGTMRQQRVKLHATQKSQVGEPPAEINGGWTRRRMYKDETARLAAERRFVQYKPKPGQQDQEHARALADVRLLLNQHAENGAWLWDPYLGAEDIIDTLFHCTHSGVELKALTAALEPPSQPSQLTSFMARQQKTFADANGNCRGLRLEYRAKVGPAGWGFHDRFLIFPGEERGALAWSLGTSVNSLGKQHHILQRVDDGQLVMDAFVELWDQLNKPEHLVWKLP